MSKIIGSTTTTPVPRSDWSQTDKTKADFIRHKPELGAIAEKDVINKTDLNTDIQSSLEEINTKANIVTITTEEYTALEKAQATNANTLYMITDAEEENGGTGDVECAVLYTEQTLTDEQKAQARTNIGAGQPIIDVFNELPTENIDNAAFYRLTTANWVRNNEIYDSNSCYYTNDLPASGIPAIDLATSALTVYYNTSDGTVYAYIDDMLSSFIASEFSMTVPTGWYPFENFTGLLGMNYGGVVTSMDDAWDENTFYIIVSSALYSYNNQWEPLKEEREIVQSDWSQEDDTQPDYIQNKPLYNGKIQPSLLYQPDWQQTKSWEPDYIKNKPAEVVENNKIKSEYLYQPDWNVCDESNFSAIKNRPVYTILEGTVFYDGEAINYSEDGWSETMFTLGWLDKDLEYHIEWGNLLFQNTKLTFKNDTFYIDDNCYIHIGLGVNNSNIHDNLGRVPAGSVRLRITVAKDYIKKLDEKYLPLLVGKRDIGINAEIFNDYVNNVASGSYSHAEGYNTTASGYYSHAEGYNTTASGYYSHAEGYNTTASNSNSHAEGYNTTASGHSSHAEGYNTTASGDYSHAEGINTKASGYYSHVQGKYNIEDTENKYAHIVGNGKYANNRSNAHTLDWDGNAWFQGNVYVGGTGQDDTIAKRLLTEDDLSDCSLPKATTDDNGKLLQVVDGKPTWVSITNGNEVAY